MHVRTSSLLLYQAMSLLPHAMKVLKMTALDDLPSKEFIPIWTADIKERREAIKRVSLKVVDKFVDFTFHKEKINTCKTISPSDLDLVYSYATEVLSLGLFFQEYSDAIREGDGTRVLRCWRYILPLFIASHRTNYSIEAFNILYQYHFMLSPRQAEQLIWSRFINTQGRPGRNVPCDLHIEHLNRLVKGAIGSLGSNKTEKCIKRVAKAIGTLKPVLDNFDADNGINDPSGVHKMSSATKECTVLVKELISNVLAFDKVNDKQRKHKSFPSITSSLLHNLSYEQLIDWIDSHIPHKTCK